MTWYDVSDQASLTLAQLIAMGISEKDLHHIQPDVRKWIKHKSVNASDVQSMLRWPLHPIKDLDGDLSDLMMGGYSAHVLHQLRVTYSDLLALHMSPQHMRVFHYTLQEWELLGFSRHDLQKIPEDLCLGIFGAGKVPTEEKMYPV
jgi:hypothetical protein